ncbi:hypothetical protein H257_10075 [Aphanomyces astaci]|uniref:Uncharacterized protein n=1 Tax=Aphanomyces astaci TaxID=112090 RepID=W4G7K8_APHAT|nr:hypothetical protein H257_10075 [Aphanomyces astaci]ETV75687.1 hypothetical protein H257_10075 [Aphanomyces astaci]|eukprot:XP_009834818.1 hypothetical protein H257_10075 [Aphanomyces astaci]
MAMNDATCTEAAAPRRIAASTYGSLGGAMPTEQRSALRKGHFFEKANPLTRGIVAEKRCVGMRIHDRNERSTGRIGRRYDDMRMTSSRRAASQENESARIESCFMER